MNWLHDLLGEMAAHGLAPTDGVIADGDLHRFRVHGDKPGSRNGWYVAHVDGHPAAAFGTWKTGEQHTWRLSGPHRGHCDTRQQHQQIAAERQRRQSDEAQMHAEAATRARRIWDSAIDPDPRHLYLRGKAVGSHGIRQHDDALIIPLRDIAGKLWSLQFIASDGSKRFLRGGRVKGMFHVIGTRTPCVWLCEGYATGASLHQDRRECVVVALNCGNLLAVAEAIAKHWRPQSLTLMADDDWQTPENPGLTAARAVAQKLEIEWYTPEFPPNRPAWATDYNDACRLWVTHGRRSA